MPNLNYGLQSTGVQLVDATNRTHQTQTELTEVQTRIINIIKGNDKITQKEMAIELDIPESSVKYHVMSLRKKGILKREGTIHNGHWIIMKTE